MILSPWFSCTTCSKYMKSLSCSVLLQCSFISLVHPVHMSTWSKTIALFNLDSCVLRILAKICNFWTIWPVIQLLNYLFKIRQKSFCLTDKNLFVQCSIHVKSAVKRLSVGFSKDGLLADFCCFCLITSTYP